MAVCSSVRLRLFFLLQVIQHFSVSSPCHPKNALLGGVKLFLMTFCWSQIAGNAICEVLDLKIFSGEHLVGSRLRRDMAGPLFHAGYATGSKCTKLNVFVNKSNNERDFFE